jgi:hypothetical protein
MNGRKTVVVEGKEGGRGAQGQQQLDDDDMT